MPEPQTVIPIPQNQGETTMDKLSHFDVVKSFRNAFGGQTKEQKAQDIANKQKPDYKTLATTMSSPEEYNNKAANIKAAQNLHNPFDAPNPQLQLIAHGAKLSKLQSDPRYSGLSDHWKLRVLEKYYNKYTEPILKANGIDPPGFDRWAQGQHAESYDKAQTENQGDKPNVATEFASGYYESTAKLAKLGANVIRYATPNVLGGKGKSEAIDKLNRAANGLDKLNTDYHSAFQTDHSVSGWLANTTGNVIGDAPAYILAGEVAGPLVQGGAKVLGVARFAKSIKYMKEAGEIFSIDKLEGKSTEQAGSDATLGPLLGFGLRGAASLVRRPLNAAGDAWLKRVNFKGSQVGVGGIPFANTISEMADKLGGTEGEGVEKTKSIVLKGSADLEQAAMNELHLRESVARDYYGHKVDPENPSKSIWRNLSKGQRDKVRQYIANITKTSAETMPLTSPHVQTLANENEIEQFIKENPEQDADFKAIHQLFGINPAEALTEVQAQSTAQKIGVNTPTQHLDQAFHGAEENPEALPEVSGGSGRLKSGHVVDYNRRDDNANIKETVTANAEDFINKTMKYLPNSKATKSGKIYFEHPEHHLLQIARNSDAPSAIKSKAEGFLAREFGHDQGSINRRAGWLKEHIADLERTGHIRKEGNVFRSTRLQQRRYGTQWQKEVYSPETFEAQMNQVKALIKGQPKLKAVFSPMIKDLILFKNKGAKAETVAERAEFLEKAVKDFKKVHRIK